MHPGYQIIQQKKNSFLTNFTTIIELDHPNIVRLLDTVEIDDNTFATILELCDGMDLSQFLKKHKVVSEKDAKIIICQIVTALKYLNNHPQKIIHYE